VSFPPGTEDLFTSGPAQRQLAIRAKHAADAKPRVFAPPLLSDQCSFINPLIDFRLRASARLRSFD